MICESNVAVQSGRAHGAINGLSEVISMTRVRARNLNATDLETRKDSPFPPPYYGAGMCVFILGP